MRQRHRVIDGREELHCCACDSWKALDEYHKDASAKYGRQYRCKPCACTAVRRAWLRRKYRDVLAILASIPRMTLGNW